MAIKVTIGDYQDAADFITANAKSKDGKAAAELHASDVYKFYEDKHGLDRATVDKVARANEQLAGGSIMVSTDRLIGIIDTTRERGETVDPTTSYDVKVPTPFGTLEASTQAMKVTMSPPRKNPDGTPAERQTFERYGYTELTIRRTAGAPGVVAERARDLVAQALGIALETAAE